MEQELLRLQARYAGLSTDELLSIWVSADLTRVAQQALQAELQQRNIAEADVLEAQRLELQQQVCPEQEQSRIKLFWKGMAGVFGFFSGFLG